MSSRPPGAVDATFRRTWDKEEYERRARERVEREREERDPAAKRRRQLQEAEEAEEKKMLKARDYRPDLDSRLGKTVMVAGARDAASGYHCKVCDCVLKDSKTYLDHINGRKHQKALGFQMQVERHSADDVKARLAAKKKTQAQSKEKPSEAYSFEERIAKLQEEEALRKKEKKEAKKKRKQEEAQAESELEGGLDPEMAALMGFSGFGGSKKT